MVGHANLVLWECAHYSPDQQKDKIRQRYEAKSILNPDIQDLTVATNGSPSAFESIHFRLILFSWD